METQPILFDYAMSPYGYKVRLALTTNRIAFKQCDQPLMLPRLALQGLGIQYRRIPLLAIGKDIYCDSTAIVARLQEIANPKILSTTPADMAFEAFSTRVFWGSWPLIPTGAITPEFARDRKSIAPVFSRPDFGSLRPSALAEFKSVLDIVENSFLGSGKGCIGGDSLSIGDIHVGAVIKWVLETLGVNQMPAFDKSEYPRIYQWLTEFPEPDFETISGENACDLILGSSHTAGTLKVDLNDALSLPAGTPVFIESTDAAPGADPQTGLLVGLSNTETVIELENGLRLHFPRRGFFVRKLEHKKDA